MKQLVEVDLGEYRPAILVDQNQIECVRGDVVILDVERASEFGTVVSVDVKSCTGKKQNPKGRIIRLATDGDLKQIENNKNKSTDAVNICLRRIVERKLDMRVAKAEYSFDSSKVIFSFTAEGRVDFRNLVKDLAQVLRVRIELKQIGVRDKAKIIGGYGVCGRELCCSSFIKDFHPLSIKMAKEQNLPLNPSKISGVCGRIKCCMAYEYTVYREYARSIPRLGQKIQTDEGKAIVINVNILKRFVDVELEEGKILRIDYAKQAANK